MPLALVRVIDFDTSNQPPRLPAGSQGCVSKQPREEMKALRTVLVLFGVLGCVQSLDTIGFMVKRVVSPEQSLTPMKIGGSEFVSPERGRNLYRRSSIIQSGCPDSAQCNISFNFSEVKRVELED